MNKVTEMPRSHRSVEFFPPKDEAAENLFRQTAEAVAAWGPDWVSITYGAGGKTRENTFRWSRYLQNELNLRVIPHLTCVAQTREELETMIKQIADEGFAGIMALRGDAPQGHEGPFPCAPGLKYAGDLVEFIKMIAPELEIGVAGYPERHPEAPSLDQDIEHLKNKVNRGADHIVTQLFFDNADFFNFETRIREAGIAHPLVPGLMPPTSLARIEKFCNFCGSRIPPGLRHALSQAGGSGEAARRAGIDWTLSQLRGLAAAGHHSFHLYILNNPTVFRILAKELDSTS